LPLLAGDAISTAEENLGLAGDAFANELAREEYAAAGARLKKRKSSLR
jgi:hypothetical protein